jgi:hypothetical protein
MLFLSGDNKINKKLTIYGIIYDRSNYHDKEEDDKITV